MTLPAMPSAHHVAAAVVAACRATGQDPVECVSRKQNMRGRYYAFAALRKLFPAAPGTSLARMVGATGGSAACFPSNVVNARHFPWWDESVVTGVREAVMPPAPVIETSPWELTPAEIAYAEPMSPNGRRAFDAAPPAERQRIMRAYAEQHPAAAPEPAGPPTVAPAPAIKPPLAAPPRKQAQRPPTAAVKPVLPARKASGFDIPIFLGHMRPDRPAQQRGAEVVPVAGEPEPGRSALDQRNSAREASNA